MRDLPLSPIPLFDRKPVNPFVPIGVHPAIARSIGQGRPQAGARALPLTDASTVACSRPFGHVCRARMSAFVIVFITVTGGAIVSAFASPAQAQNVAVAANPSDPFAAHIAEASQRFGVPEGWIRAVMRAESAGRIRAISSAGAMGLMQIIPATWAELRIRHRLGSDPYDPRDNILAGAAYLREMHDRYGSPGFLAAYNAGPGRYEEHLSTGRMLPAETRDYVAALAPWIDGGQVERSVVIAADPNAWTRAPLFIVRVENASLADRPPPRGQSVVRPISDLSALEPSSGRHTNDTPSGASLFVARASSGPER